MNEDMTSGIAASEGMTAREENLRAGEAGSTAREGVPHVQVGGSEFVGLVFLPCLSDRFTALADLGSGGEANVLLAADGAGDRWVVKQYRRRGWSPSPEVLERLEDARADHSLVSWGQDASVRGVVWLQESGVDPSTGLFFEVMEFVEGGSLSGAGSQWPFSELVRALTDAVSAFHLLVGAHRDIKPANVLVRSAEKLVLVLVDLGLARDLADGGQRYSKREGSAAYQAPEASQGLVSRAGDWWSVGMILAEEALGFHPYARGDRSLLPDEVIHAELAQRDVPHLDAIVDDRVRLLCRGLLTRDANHRWGKSQVRAWLRGESPAVVAGGATPMPESGSVSSRPRAVLFAGADHDDPRGLAAAFAARPEAAAQALFLNRDATTLKDLELMLRAHGLHDARGLLDEYRSGAWQTTFLRLLVEMDPNLAPELAGQSMTPMAMTDLAWSVVTAAEATQPQRESLEWVTDHDLWRLWRRLPSMTYSAEAAGRLMGFYAADGVTWCASAEVDEATLSQYWERYEIVGRAWMLLWALAPEAVVQGLEAELEPFRSGDDLKDQSWWLTLAQQVPNPSDGQAARWAVAAFLSRPLALTLQQESDRRLEQSRRDREQSRRDMEQVREILVERLQRQGDAYLEYLCGQLRGELGEARRPFTRGARDKRLRVVWSSLLNCRKVLRDRYGMIFARIAPDAYDRASDKAALIARELDRPPERRGWNGGKDPGWIPPAPLLIGLAGQTNVVVDPLLGEIFGSWTGGSPSFCRSRHGRILMGDPLCDPLGGGGTWTAAGDVALEERPVPDYYIVRAGADENSRVLEYSGSGGGPGPTIGANVPVKDVRPMTMPDGCRVAVVLTRSGLLSYLDLHALHLLPLPAVEVHGASRIYVPPWDSPRRSASGKR